MRLIITICLIFLFAAGVVSAQSTYEERRNEIVEQQNQAREKIDFLNRQISEYNERLDFATDRFEHQYNQYLELNRVITLQQQKLVSMRDEQNKINEEIQLIRSQQNELEDKLADLIRRYKETLTYLYKYGRTNEVALLLTSSSMNQLLVRSFYLSRFDEYQQAQADEIRNTQKELEAAKNDLEKARDRNSEALAEIEIEMNALAEKEKQQKRNIELLRRDRNNIRNQLAIVEEQAEQLNNTLDRLYEEEQRIRNAAREGGSGSVLKSAVSRDELEAFEAEFAGKKGKLPWPVENGTITEKFGIRTHPVFATKTDNPGIDIAAPAKSSVYTVSEGIVYAIEPLKGYGTVVIVNHGNYNTAYGNLTDVFVRKNQVLRQGDVIGLSGDKNSIKGEVLFFLIRDGHQNVNPVNWLQKPLP